MASAKNLVSYLVTETIAILFVLDSIDDVYFGVNGNLLQLWHQKYHVDEKPQENNNNVLINMITDLVYGKPELSFYDQNEHLIQLAVFLFASLLSLVIGVKLMSIMIDVCTGRRS